MFREGSRGGCGDGALQHRRHPGAARGPRGGSHRQPATHLRRSGDGSDCRSLARRGPRPGYAAHERNESVPRHHGVSGAGARGGRLRGERSAAGHLGSGEPGSPRCRRGSELRLLALGDVQQRRHEGDLHGRMGRRNPPAVPGDGSPHVGGQRHLRHRRSPAAVRRVLQAARSADGGGELRGAQRIDRAGARARHHGAGVVPGGRVGVRLHRIREAGRDRVLRSGPYRPEAAHRGRLLVGVLVQRRDLRGGDVARARRVPAHAGCASVAERDRGRRARPAGRLQRAAAATCRAPRRPGRRTGISRSADACERDLRGSRSCGAAGARTAGTGRHEGGCRRGRRPGARRPAAEGRCGGGRRTRRGAAARARRTPGAAGGPAVNGASSYSGISRWNLPIQYGSRKYAPSSSLRPPFPPSRL